MHLEAHVHQYAVTYFRIAMQFSFFQALISSMSGIFRSFGQPKIAVCVSLFVSGLMAFLDYLVIFQPFSFPLTGVFGIACSYVFAVENPYRS